jgi:hypothetical protein
MAVKSRNCVGSGHLGQTRDINVTCPGTDRDIPPKGGKCHLSRHLMAAGETKASTEKRAHKSAPGRECSVALGTFTDLGTAAPVTTKNCTACGEAKPLTEFFRAQLYAEGLTPRCKACVFAAAALAGAGRHRYRRNAGRPLDGGGGRHHGRPHDVTAATISTNDVPPAGKAATTNAVAGRDRSVAVGTLAAESAAAPVATKNSTIYATAGKLADPTMAVATATQIATTTNPLRCRDGRRHHRSGPGDLR